MKLNEKEFDQIVQRAIGRIPKEIRQHLDNIIISVRKKPSRRLLKEMDMPPGELLLGLYEGVCLPERSAVAPPLLPDTILLFQQPLLAVCSTIEELEEQIEKTVAHEVGHCLGLSEERLSELGFD